MMNLVPDPVFAYKVWYQGRPGYVSIQRGFNGPFDRLEDALAQVAKTKKYWNTEVKRTERMPERSGKLEITITERTVEKVDVWIDQYKDGYFLQHLDEEGHPWPKEAQKEEPKEEEKEKESVGKREFQAA